MGTRILGGALGVIGTAIDAVRHIAWFVTYHVDGSTRDADEPPRDS